MATKESWPELVGKTEAEAREQVAADRPDVTIQVLKEGSPATMDFRTDRVRIIVDSNGHVVGAPMTG